MMEKLNLDSLDDVVGGFSEQNPGLPTKGMNIKCPRCHSDGAKSFAEGALYDPNIGSVEYKCKCGCQFVCMHGKVILKDDFLDLCNKKGITYTF